MSEHDPIHLAQRTLERLQPRLEAEFSAYAAQNSRAWGQFQTRLKQHFPRLFQILLHLYGNQYDFFYHIEVLLRLMAHAWTARDAALQTLDAAREEHPDWFQSHHILGGVCYTDLFAGDLAGIREKIPYFKALGLTTLHLMPLFKSPEGENDGGYAISSYREVDPRLGTMEELRALAEELRAEGISLVLDFVFNHTSSEHEWAVKARAGNPVYQEYYRMFPDRQMPDAYETHLREIFPDEHPGAFTYFDDIGQWVWTTFHSNQWDLNYANPEVFNQMSNEMLFLANQGVEVLRLDAVAFIWKELGTTCENLPEAHMLIQAFNAIARIAAPALLFKSEAIVHPDEVAKYIHSEECQLSYNPLLMALLWNSLATREVALLHYSMSNRFALPPGCAWVNYVRCHDDIGWTFSDEDANALGIHAFDHRQFLNAFFTGVFDGSFGRGLPFQENPITRDARISGTCASLAGLEKAITEETGVEVDIAIRRILLIHNVILSIGGIPLIYLGDEVGTLNDYSYRQNPAKADDSRWVHRPEADPELYALSTDESTIPGKIFHGLQNLIELRKSTPIIQQGLPEFIDSGNPHVFAYRHAGKEANILFLNNFSDQPQTVPNNVLRLCNLVFPLVDMVSGTVIKDETVLSLAPCQYLWLQSES
ncbi:MAG TPA: amylosucrase [Brevefilum sp.]|nr:amylosucrase [Brevefilum sp.]